MQRQIILIFLLSIWTLQCSSQNKTTPEGLKIGMWEEEYLSSRNVESIAIGLYKIIPISTYDTIEPLDDWRATVKYKGSTPSLYIDGRYNNFISVKDNLWHITDSNGKIYKITNWEQGLEAWTRYYDESGNLTNYDYNDFENDTSFQLIYLNKQLYKKSFYPPDDKNHETEIFYPDNDLIIPDAEPRFYSVFSTNIVDTLPLKLTCKKDLSIISISSSSPNIQISSPNKSVPCRLTSEDTATFHLIFMPTSANFRENDTITIVTSEAEIPPYKIYCTSKAAHIDGSNVESLKEITLSKSKDRYLYISQMGTVTEALFFNSYGLEEKKSLIHGLTKFNLNEFKLGVYTLEISSCNNGGSIKLRITE